ncbi:MAG: hypothetical protein MJ078_02665, partial [Clostridia bacterium]|nr:hypothetical protein [Clostridia bacterium]
KPGDSLFIGGIELNCSDEKGKYHILGYCYDESKTSIVKAVSKNHKARFDKVAHRLKHLEREYGIVFSPTELHRIYENENPGKPVIVALMREKGLIKDDKTGFEMLSCPIPEAEALTPEEAIDAILEADGIPVLAHGILADGDTHLSEEALTERVARLKRAGLMGLEAYYSAFSQEDITVTLALARTYGLMVTAGSDYHGVGKHGGVLPGQTHSPSPDEMNRFYRAVEKLLLQ